MKISWRTESLQWLVIAAMFASAAIAWPYVPERIPVHWNLQGEIDGYGGRFTGLLLLPLITLGNYFLFLGLPLIDPGRVNYANFATVYQLFRNLIICFLGVVHSVLLLVALGYHVDVTLVICLAAGALLIVMGNVLGKVRPNWFVGFRTPWTLSSRESWNRTNRAGGWFLIGLGLLTPALALFRNLWIFVIWIGYLAICVIGLSFYSYVIYRNDPHRTSPAGTSPETE